MTDTNNIEWGYNCLTDGVHHGRPEAIWNIPLLHASRIMRREALYALVIERIYSDAKQIVEHHDGFDEAWAERVKSVAEEMYINTLTHKVGELVNYYKSPIFENDMIDAARRFAENRLNPGYEPLHGHDTINMLCRIVGMSARRGAERD